MAFTSPSGSSPPATSVDAGTDEGMPAARMPSSDGRATVSRWSSRGQSRRRAARSAKRRGRGKMFSQTAVTMRGRLWKR